MGMFAGTPFDRPPRCERCEELETDCQCPPEVPAGVPPQQQTARLSLEKRKRGKVVTCVLGLSAVGGDLPRLFTRLKSACGAGGALHDGELEIQGDHRERIRETLKALGYRVQS